MPEVSEYFEPFESSPNPQLYSGSAKLWYDEVRHSDFKCASCSEKFTVLDGHVTLSADSGKPGITDKVLHYLTGKNAYDVSDETVENGLFTEKGKLVTGIVKCPYCCYSHGHYYDSVRNKFSIPNSDFSELSSR